MRLRRTRRLLAVTALALALLALPAHADTTTTTFTLSAGLLSISVPVSADLGSAATGSASLSSQLGAVTVTDARGALGEIWTATVSATDFTTGAASSNETIAKASVSYWSGTATAATGTAVRVPGQLAAGNAQSLSTARTAFSASATVGNNTTTWNPTLVVTIPAAAVAGTYTGTVTHSVA
jgi:hypothetical protein